MKLCILAALVLGASPALAATLPVEIIPTDEGFRQRADCRPVYRLRNWWDEHYWSARPTWACTDEPYFSGKGGVLVSLDPEPEPDPMPWPALYDPPTEFSPPGTPFTVVDLPPPGTPGPPPWGTPPSWPADPPRWAPPPPPAPIPPPIPLPSSNLMLALALASLFAISWRQRR